MILLIIMSMFLPLVIVTIFLCVKEAKKKHNGVMSNIEDLASAVKPISFKEKCRNVIDVLWNGF